MLTVGYCTALALSALATGLVAGYFIVHAVFRDDTRGYLLDIRRLSEELSQSTDALEKTTIELNGAVEQIGQLQREKQELHNKLAIMIQRGNTILS